MRDHNRISKEIIIMLTTVTKQNVWKFGNLLTPFLPK